MRDELLALLLDAKVNHRSEDEVFALFAAEQKAAGNLPVAAFGELDLEATRVEVVSLADTILPLVNRPLDDHEVDIAFLVDGHEVRLQGWLKQRYQSGLVRYRSGKIRAQDQLTTWFDHLCLAVSGRDQQTHLIGTDKHLVLLKLDAEQALLYLQDAIELYYHGLNQPLPYFPKTAQVGIQACIGRDGSWKDDEETIEKSLKKMADCFNDGYLFPGEGSDSYIARVWPQWNDELAVEASQLASRVLQAAILNSETVED